ncbi:restriction alleviation protein%2C Lar family [Yersinia enterocolitica]|uniref:Lar family restriction alleviation protein n=1 Tax=Yersinia enterocolitica TaxID=630 RepID=UPI0005DC43E0|nr:Lar family restriction alleviation protein [Yersinia enterocolitica]CNF20864.1 restriction alleviation protein%2C Lar family [Yersinia enterocolitica]HDL7851579.1 Lar family restriction alleviation protein [Yersinia enterocolitica]
MSENTDEKLKPCPFCGGKAHLLTSNGSFLVECSVCLTDFLNGPVGIGWYRSEKDAAADWNDRPSERALITQLEAAQKERDVYANLASDVGDIITLLQNNEWAEHVGKTNVGGLLEYQITQLVNSIADINTKLLAAEAALSAANEKVSKPVVLPRMHVGFDGVSTNAGDSVRNKAISDCAEAIRTAGFTADEGKDLWLM